MASPLCFQHYRNAGQRRDCATQHCTGPNHELALVMTKERAGVMAKPSVLPQACSM
jgi:hypothetical protein